MEDVKIDLGKSRFNLEIEVIDKSFPELTQHSYAILPPEIAQEIRESDERSRRSYEELLLPYINEHIKGKNHVTSRRYMFRGFIEGLETRTATLDLNDEDNVLCLSKIVEAANGVGSFRIKYQNGASDFITVNKDGLYVGSFI